MESLPQRLPPWDAAGHTPDERRAVTDRMNAWAPQLAELLAQVRFSPEDSIEMPLDWLEAIAHFLVRCALLDESDEGELLHTRAVAIADQIVEMGQEWRKAGRRARRLANRQVRP